MVSSVVLDHVGYANAIKQVPICECGQQPGVDDRFCTDCGRRLRCEKCSASFSPGSTICARCNAERPTDGELYMYKFDGDFRIANKPLRISPRLGNHIGARVWDAGIVLAKYFEQYVQSMMAAAGKRQLVGMELGCGTGIAGLGFALMGQRVILSDMQVAQEEPVASIELNASDIKTAGGSAEFSILDWSSLRDRNDFGHFDVAFGADVIWYSALVPKLVQALLWVNSGAGASKILIAGKHRRNESVFHEFEMQAKAAGLNILKRELSTQSLGDAGNENVFFYHLAGSAP
eukprot:TRINITY_DN88593_c0_g1_i1.p1 TRINITY_DN88593_c0_g1~~TRINITY_DN88593_c0_g1_i1.p1  ORF type:complete len:290 (-),score=43.94 TRINITY_DN88593_c0_g1_i1:170-1039(-)